MNEAFIPIKKSIIQVLGRFQEKVQQIGSSIDRIAIVGGFSQFPRVWRQGWRDAQKQATNKNSMIYQLMHNKKNQ